METRANYVLIGACALLAIVLGLGFFVWLAKVQIDRQYAYYDILFDNVSGLSRAADVRFSGLSVGQVVSLELDEKGSGRVRVRIEVDGRHADPRGRDGAAAVTGGDRGLARVAQPGRRHGEAAPARHHGGGAGDPGRALGGAVADRGRARPPGGIDQAREGVPGPRRARRTRTRWRRSSATSSRRRARSRRRWPTSPRISKSVAGATGQISDFTDKLDPLAVAIEKALVEARTTMAAMTGAFNTAATHARDRRRRDQDNRRRRRRGRPGHHQGRGGGGGRLQGDGHRAAPAGRDPRRRGEDGARRLRRHGDDGDGAAHRARGDRSRSLDKAIDGATTALASVDSAATSFDTLVEGDGTALVAEARTTLASVQASAAAIESGGDRGPAGDHRRRAAGDRRRSTRPSARSRPTSRRFTGDLEPVTAKAASTLEAASADLPGRERGHRPAGAGDRLGRADARRRRGRLHRGGAGHQRGRRAGDRRTCGSRPSG